MEFNEKLQMLRKQKGLTQEELAKDLYVSRTAISKWESGRGVPNIESLKAVSEYFSVTIDQLLTGEEILTIADEESRQKEANMRDLVCGLLDCSLLLFFFLPFFGQRSNAAAGGTIYQVSLLSLADIGIYIKAAYVVIVCGIVLSGILTLALQNCQWAFWKRYKYHISVGLSALATIIFMATLQPYAAVLAFVFLAIKCLMQVKRR